jgi:hypothetical protein
MLSCRTCQTWIQAWRRSSVVLVVTAVAFGCGKGAGDLGGRVSYKNKPLPYGWVKMNGSDGIFRDAKIESDGTYAFKDVPVGEAKFTVSCVDPKIEEFTRSHIANQRSGKVRDGVPGAGEPDPFDKFYLIPRLYEDITKSPLSFKIEAGTNVYNIDLK